MIYLNWKITQEKPHAGPMHRVGQRQAKRWSLDMGGRGQAKLSCEETEEYSGSRQKLHSPSWEGGLGSRADTQCCSLKSSRDTGPGAALPSSALAPVFGPRWILQLLPFRT